MSLMPVIVTIEPPLPEIVVTREDALTDIAVTVSDVGIVGPVGPTGPAGPAGPPGSGGAGASYIHTQVSPAASWTVQHNLGAIRHPVIILAGETEPILTDTVYPDLNTIVLIFPAPAAGMAYV